ncbi:putative cadmium-transporting ATPase [Caulifigura coniformis]|uniref:P-type Zn(2+) transporter n=1 Tax=Caulifigura coniformis TaxID=2527983 RepID=A0A517S9F9_9PLAN|nr:heavy metal translocating P-type ATPase [Caulifigura coniformis]QDT52767.1 putative cadmium-transporting ATPase [Caulifigura coniformis]
MEQVQFRVFGMDCAEEVTALRGALDSLNGVQNFGFDILNGKMTVDFDQSQITRDDIGKIAAQLTGLRLEQWNGEGPTGGDAGGWTRWGRTTMTVASGALLAAGFLAHTAIRGFSSAFRGGEEVALPPAVKLLYVVSAICGAWFVAPKAWHALRRCRPDVNLLMIVAVTGAVLIGEYLEAAMVAFLFAVSLALESWSIARARHAIAALMTLAPDTATQIDSAGQECTLPVADVMVGSRLIVRPGEKVPLDGKVIKGESTVNQAPITGESLPVAKAPGAVVFAGTINEEGALEIESTKPANDTTLSRIIRMVGDSQSQRSPSEQWVEKFASYYTPAIFATALAVMILPPLFSGIWGLWFYRGLVLLVIACPCALVISTPVSIVAALTSAAKAGVLVKGGPALEAPAHLKAVAIDKTGTLTIGQPGVRQVEALAGHDSEDVLRIAAAIERRSEHPLARAVLRAASARGIEPAAADDFQAIKGKGATAKVDGVEYWLGSHRMLDERRLDEGNLHERILQVENDGSSVIVLGTNTLILGWIALADSIRPEARAAVESIREAGVEHVIMLTGDNRGTGEAIGRLAAVDEVRTELLPEDKVAAIKELVAKYGHVAMVGDGVNDAPAMALASLGIAMGTVGTDAALETADVALMRDDLSMVGWLIHHSRRTLTIIRQNIYFSLGVKALFLLLTMFGRASLWAAIAADMGASLLVIFNGLRLLNSSPRAQL